MATRKAAKAPRKKRINPAKKTGISVFLEQFETPKIRKKISPYDLSVTKTNVTLTQNGVSNTGIKGSSVFIVIAVSKVRKLSNKNNKPVLFVYDKESDIPFQHKDVALKMRKTEGQAFRITSKYVNDITGIGNFMLNRIDNNLFKVFHIVKQS